MDRSRRRVVLAIYEHKMISRKSGNTMTVSCDCRAVLGKHAPTGQGGEYFEPMFWPGGFSAIEIYNRPENHYTPFTYKDVIR